MLKPRAHHSGKFGPRKNNPLYMQYVGINCNPRQGDTIYNYQLVDNYNILLPGGFELIYPYTGKSCDISLSAYNFTTVCLIHTSFLVATIIMHIASHIIVTGYLKTDHNVTLGQLHFIGPANSHTCTLLVHHCINRLS